VLGGGDERCGVGDGCWVLEIGDGRRAFVVILCNGRGGVWSVCGVDRGGV
jgi:hypothetical protein